MPIIDAHLHLWDLDRLHYHWLSPEDTLLYRNVTAAEVEPLLQKCGIDGALLVEAANTSEEIGYMLELAAEHRWIKGVIGWASVNDPPSAYVERLCGVRLPWLHSEADVVIPAVVREHGLACDIIADAEAYPLVIKLAQAAPELTFVLAHFGLPRMTPDGAAAWAEQLAPVAALPNMVMKLSGHMTSADPRPLQAETLQRYVQQAVRLFGAERLTYGSNYPILLWAGTFEDDSRLIHAACADLPEAAQEAIFSGTATRVYRLEERG